MFSLKDSDDNNDGKRQQADIFLVVLTAVKARARVASSARGTPMRFFVFVECENGRFSPDVRHLRV